MFEIEDLLELKTRDEAEALLWLDSMGIILEPQKQKPPTMGVEGFTSRVSY